MVVATAVAATMFLSLQAPPATVTGVVRGREGRRPLVGAVVSLPDAGRAALTDATGRYELRDVSPGPQHILVRSVGYAPHILHALVPSEGRLDIDVVLNDLAYHLPPLNVPSNRAIALAIATADSVAYPDRMLGIAAIRNDPRLAEPDVFAALSGAEVAIDPETPSGVHIRGGGSDQTGFLLDGIPVFNPYHAAGLFSGWNPDALAGVRIDSDLPSYDGPSALAGSVTGFTRAPGKQIGGEGSVSSTQVRMTVDGPVGLGGVAFMLSLRKNLLGSLIHPHEASYLRGEAGDWLAKLEAPVLGGHLRLLGYGTSSELGAASLAESDTATAWSGSNSFGWQSRSFGAEWRHTTQGASLRLLGWSAATGAGAGWDGTSGLMMLGSSRRDEGALASVERKTAGASTLVGLRVERSVTSYRVRSGDVEEPPLDSRLPIATAFANHARTLGRFTAGLGVSLAAAAGEVYPDPTAQLRYRPSNALSFSATWARTHQFAQSLRNAESVVRNVFPADLYVGAGTPGVPVAQSAQGVLAADYRPGPGIRIGFQAWTRDMTGLLLMTPENGEPFARGNFDTGSGTSRGVSLEGSLSRAGWGVLASYTAQQVRFSSEAMSYRPDFNAVHRVEGGVILHPSATFSIRFGGIAEFGRRTTALTGGLEWEACNLFDLGCEFGGSPNHNGQPVGAVELPGYARLDLSARKHWHLAIGGRDQVVGLFGTVTNVLDRRNVLTWARDQRTGDATPIEMRPLAPLVVGLDWRF